MSAPAVFCAAALLARGEGHERVGREAQRGDERVLHGREELRDAAGELALVVDAHPVGLVAAGYLRVGAELVYLLARALEAAHGHGLDHRALEGAEAAAADELRDVRGREVDAQVGLVGAVFLERLDVGDAREGRAGGAAILAELREDGRQHVLEDLEDVLLAREGHLHVELVELAGGAVGARVLVAEAGGYLEVAVEAAGHQQLLELLRGLREGVELARVVARGDKVVARALGAGDGEYRRRYLHEAVLGHAPAQRGDDVGAQDDVALDLGVPEVEVAVL